MISTSAMPFLPTWLRVMWVVALSLVAGIHIRLAFTMSGRARCWHAGHVGVALAMAGAYLIPQASYPHIVTAGAVLVAIGAIWVLVLGWIDDRLVDRLGVATTLDLLAMTYMTLPAREQFTLATGVMVIALSLQLLLWPLALRSFRGRPALASRRAGNLMTSTRHNPLARLAAPIMAASMAYMLIAMHAASGTAMHMHMLPAR